MSLRRFINRIRIIYYWLPIIWNDTDWDYGPLLQVMQHKIRRMRIGHEKWQRHIGWERTVRQLRIAESLLQRMLESDYSSSRYKELGKKYPRELFESNPAPFTEQERKEWKQAFDHEAYMLRQDEETFLRVFLKHYKSWWD